MIYITYYQTVTVFQMLPFMKSIKKIVFKFHNNDKKFFPCTKSLCKFIGKQSVLTSMYTDCNFNEK